jgi:MYXO-CTERM domain-containing protein
MKRLRECALYGALAVGLAAAPAFSQVAPGSVPDDRAGTVNDDNRYPNTPDNGSRHNFGWLGLLGLVGLAGLMKHNRTENRTIDDRPITRP